MNIHTGPLNSLRPGSGPRLRNSLFSLGLCLPTLIAKESNYLARACHQLAGFGRWAPPAYWAGKSRLPHSAANRRWMMRNQFRRGGFFDS